MYKVYFENKVIIFANNNCINNNNFIQYNLLSGDILPDRATLFDNINSKEGAVIISETPFDELKRFSKCFKEITAAGGVVRNNDNKILMIFRHNRWDLPKGKIEKDEKIIECASREVTEECSITPLVVGDELSSTFHIYPLHGEWIIKRTYWFKMTYCGTEIPSPQLEEDITKVEWVDESQINKYLKTSYYTIIDIFNELGLGQ